MPKFGLASRRALETCHFDIQRVFNKVIKTVDCSITEGHRNEETQTEMFVTGRSKVEWPKSKHNTKPSRAVDAIPWPVDWAFEKELIWAATRGDKKAVQKIMHNIQRWARFNGFVLGVAEAMGIKLISGADWDRDFDLTDQRFDDWPHYQLADE